MKAITLITYIRGNCCSEINLLHGLKVQYLYLVVFYIDLCIQDFTLCVCEDLLFSCPGFVLSLTLLYTFLLLDYHRSLLISLNMFLKLYCLMPCFSKNLLVAVPCAFSKSIMHAQSFAAVYVGMILGMTLCPVPHNYNLPWNLSFLSANFAFYLLWTLCFFTSIASNYS